MKTMIKTTTYVYNSGELANKITETVSKIDTFIKENNFQVSGDLSTITKASSKGIFGLYTQSNLEKGISTLSKNGLKKTNRAIQKIEIHNTMRTSNLFLHYVMKQILKSDERIKITSSVKETAIQAKRDAWKKAHLVAMHLLTEYKEEKGDFYKSVKV